MRQRAYVEILSTREVWRARMRGHSGSPGKYLKLGQSSPDCLLPSVLQYFWYHIVVSSPLRSQIAYQYGKIPGQQNCWVPLVCLGLSDFWILPPSCSYIWLVIGWLANPGWCCGPNCSPLAFHHYCQHPSEESPRSFARGSPRLEMATKMDTIIGAIWSCV